MLLVPVFIAGASNVLLAQMPASPAKFSPGFEHILLPGGPAANSVTCITQDGLGFLWFATQNGLLRYDGQRFVNYRHHPKDTNSIASDYVEWVFADSKGMLWLGHWGDGITRFDPETEKCTHFRHDPGKEESLPGNEISMIVEDREGYIWAATSKGLARLDPKTGNFKRFLHDPANPSSLSDNFVRSVYIDKAGTLWVGCGFAFDDQNLQGKTGGLNRYDGQGRFTRYLHDPQNLQSLADNRVRAIFEDSRGNFWVGSSAGLQAMDRHTGNFGQSRGPALHKNTAAFPAFYHVGFVTEDQAGRLWVGAIEGGLDVYDPSMHLIGHFEQATGMTDSLQNNQIWHFCQTHDGSIWLATASLGGKVYRLKNTENLFPYFNARDLGLKSALFPGIYEDPAGYIWLQTHGDYEGVLRFDRKTGQTLRFPYDPPMTERTFLDFEELRSDPQGNLWASTPQGLYKLTRRERETGSGRFRLDTFFNKKITARPLWPPYFDKRGNIWVSSFGGGLFRFDPQMRLHHFQHSPVDPRSIGGNQVEIGIFEDSQGDLWVPGGSIGADTANPLFLDRFNFENNTFEHFVPASESGDPIAVAEYNRNNFWMLAYPCGIRKINPLNRTFEYFPSDDKYKLFNEAVGIMVQAADGKIWLAATGFIMELNPETGQLYQYSARHGVQNFAWSWMGQGISGADGEILFCGSNGFHAFYPDRIRELPGKMPPKIFITSFELPDKSLSPQPVWEAETIRLKHKQNTFSIGISSFDFSGTDAVRFEFMLEKYDRNWRNDLREGQATYVNVSPGKYVFRARGCNSLGVWSERETVLNIVISPPWWKTGWAISLYILLIIIALYFSYQVALARRLEHADVLRLRELDTLKTRLYANITHEFRTPLTVILGNLDLMESEIERLPIARSVSSKTEVVRRYALRLLNLVNQMLDLAKLESGKMSLQQAPGELVNFLKYVVGSFHSMAETKRIRLHFLPEPEMLEMDFDAEKMQQIFSNLLSNALKFTPDGGDVYVLVAIIESQYEENKAVRSVQITVKDTGIGIPAEKIPHIFDRFYQVDNSHVRTGTGIGLALTKELVKLMGGDISVKNAPNRGAEFTVVLPVRVDGSVSTEKRAEQVLSTKAWEAETLLYEPKGPEKLQHEENGAPLILLVEDNGDVLDYLVACLPGYRLAIAKDGLEGLEMAVEMVPDLVVSDVMMPRMDGLEFCQKLRSDQITSHIPVVLLTAKADFNSKMEGLERGADAYLTKPFHKEELQLRVRKLLEVRHNLHQHYLSEAGLKLKNRDRKNASDIPALSAPENVFVKKARFIVDAHLDDFDFDIDKLCRELCLSHSQVHRKLYALTGLSATLFIRHVRLSKAKELLRQKRNWSITAVAFDCGFKDSGYFARVFKKEFGMTPQEWQNSEEG